MVFFTSTEKEPRYSSAENKKGCRSSINSEPQQTPSTLQKHQQKFESSWKDGWELAIPQCLSLISLQLFLEALSGNNLFIVDSGFVVYLSLL